MVVSGSGVVVVVVVAVVVVVLPSDWHNPQVFLQPCL